MWILNLLIPLAFMTCLLFAVNCIGMKNTPSELEQSTTDESVDDSDNKCMTSLGGISRCRLVIGVTVFFVAVVMGCLLIGCLSARASTYLMAFMLALFGVSCERVATSD
jgi:hypothetical protein